MGATGTRLPFYGFGLYLITGIFYLLPSGTPQPADYALVLLIVVALVTVWTRLPVEPDLYLVSFLFVCWILIVNTVWFMVLGDYALLKRPTQYWFNVIVMLFVAALGFYDLERLRRVVWHCCLIAITLQLFYLEFIADVPRRATGTFQNPNQLGFWALLVIACIGVIKHRSKLGILDITALAISFYITMLSLSRAASIAAALLIVGIIASCRLRSTAGITLVVMILLALGVQLASGRLIDRITNLDPVVMFSKRLSTLEDAGELVARRGYQRFLDTPEYLAFGAGEGAVYRWESSAAPAASVARAKEFHSTIGNILMSYGIVGLSVFALLLFVIFLKLPLAALLYLAPIMLYGLTHMGLRDSMFWVFLGLVFVEGRYGHSYIVTETSAAKLPQAPPFRVS